MLVIVPDITTAEELRAIYATLKAKTGLDTFLVKRRADVPEADLDRAILSPDSDHHERAKQAMVSLSITYGRRTTTWFGHKVLPPVANVRVKCKYQRRLLGLDHNA